MPDAGRVLAGAGTGVSGDLTVAPWQATGTWLACAHPGLRRYGYETFRWDGGLGTGHRPAEPASTRAAAVDQGGLLPAVARRWHHGLGYPAVGLLSAPAEPGQGPLAAARPVLREECGPAAGHRTRTGTVTAATGVAAQPVRLCRAERPGRVPRSAGSGEQPAFALPCHVAVGSAASAADLPQPEQARLAGAWQLPGSRPVRALAGRSGV